MAALLNDKLDGTPMRKLFVRLFIFAAIGIGAFYLLQHHILCLDSFEGTIHERIEDQVPTVSTDVAQEISYYYFRVETDDGRQVLVPVKQLIYFRARRGMRVSKHSFSLSLSLVK